MLVPVKDGRQPTVVRWWALGPERLDVTAVMAPKVLQRGIHEAQVYSAAVEFSGTFGWVGARLEAAGASGDSVRWEDARVVLPVSEPRGLRGPQALIWEGTDVSLSPGLSVLNSWGGGMHAVVALDTREEAKFVWKTRIDGSGNLRVAPVGDETAVMIRSSATDPRFEGVFLPETREVGPDGFAAEWRVGRLARTWASVWPLATNEAERVREAVAASGFGVTLLAGVDDYRAVERAIKYGVLFLVTVFATFFLFEAWSGLTLHGLNYLMVGAALCLFFLGLLALSEVVGFGWAYGIAAGAAVALVGFYCRAILGSGRRSGFVTLLLGGIYGYLYLVLRLEDYSLVAGTAALFGLLAGAMYATRRVGRRIGAVSEEVVA